MISTAERRLVGVDLGIGSEVCRRRTRPTVESLTLLETAALVGAPAGTRLEVVMEPTGPAWLPVAVFCTSRGHRVVRVASANAADLRRFGVPARQEQRHRRRHPRPAAAAGTGQPAAVGAARGRGRRAGPAGPGVRPAEPAGGAAPAADQGPGVRQLMPVTPLTGELTKTDLVVLVEHWADPRALLAAGRSRLLARITKTSHGQQGAARTDAWRAAAQGRGGPLRRAPGGGRQRPGRRGTYRGPAADGGPGGARRARRGARRRLPLDRSGPAGGQPARPGRIGPAVG